MSDILEFDAVMKEPWPDEESATVRTDAAALAAQDAEVDRLIEDAMATEDLVATARPLPQAEEDAGTSAPVQPLTPDDYRALMDFESDGAAVALDENCLPLPPGKEPWRIRDLNGLEWAFKQKAEADKEAAENLARAEAEVEELEKEIARLRERAAAINAPLVKRAAYFESHIRVYAEQNRAEILGSGKRKSRKFLHGELAWKAVRAGYRLEKRPGARDDLLKWAIDTEVTLDGGFRLTEDVPEVDLNAVKVHLETVSTHSEGNGGVGKRVTAPGLEWVEPGETLEVKTGES